MRLSRFVRSQRISTSFVIFRLFVKHFSFIVKSSVIRVTNMKRQKIQQVADLVPFVSCKSMHTEAFKQKVITLSEYHVFQFEHFSKCCSVLINLFIIYSVFHYPWCMFFDVHIQMSYKININTSTKCIFFCFFSYHNFVKRGTRVAAHDDEIIRMCTCITTTTKNKDNSKLKGKTWNKRYFSSHSFFFISRCKSS